jgi:hypothetical protein
VNEDWLPDDDDDVLNEYWIKYRMVRSHRLLGYLDVHEITRSNNLLDLDLIAVNCQAVRFVETKENFPEETKLLGVRL